VSWAPTVFSTSRRTSPASPRCSNVWAEGVRPRAFLERLT
jgi:hypothetical protein